MLIDLSGILAREGEQKTFSISPEGEYFSCQLGDFAYAEKGPVTLTVTHTGKQAVTLEGEGDARPDSCKEGGETDEDCCIHDKQLDTEQLLHNEILIQWPMRVLCKEDCKGICSRCGKNLNKGTCDCDTAELDPRMAVISDIFKNFKEV